MLAAPVDTLRACVPVETLRACAPDGLTGISPEVRFGVYAASRSYLPSNCCPEAILEVVWLVFLEVSKLLREKLLTGVSAERSVRVLGLRIGRVVSCWAKG